jgi:hypothetical protein
VKGVWVVGLGILLVADSTIIYLRISINFFCKFTSKVIKKSDLKAPPFTFWRNNHTKIANFEQPMVPMRL